MGLLEDGFKTIYTFPENETIKIEEISVTPFGIDGGGAINLATMRSVKWRVKGLKQLADVTDSSGTCAYDPAVLPEIIAMRGVNQLVVITLPNGAQWKVWGGLDKFQPGENTEGDRPTAEITIIATCRNNDGDEVDPEYVAPA